MTSSTQTLKNNTSGRKKFGKRYKAPEHLTEEEKKAWKKEQRKIRNKEAAKISRERKKQQSEDAKKEAEDWKQKYFVLKNRKEVLEKGELDNAMDASSGVSTGIEEQIISSKTTSTGKDDKLERKKYGIRYQPTKEMSDKELSDWLAEQRKERNKKAAANSRSKKLKEFEEVLEKVQYWKKMHDDLQECVDLLEKNVAERALSIRGLSRLNSITEGSVFGDFVNRRENDSSMHLLSTVSTLIDEQNRDGKIRIPQRIHSDLLKDNKIHSFLVRHEDSVSSQTTIEDSFFHSSSSSSVFQSLNSSTRITSPVLTEQQGQQDVTTTTDHSYQTSTDIRSDEQCDRDFQENMAARMAEMKKQLLATKL